MKLYECEAKYLFAEEGIPVPPGREAVDTGEALLAANTLGYPVMVKAQVLRGGRGKAGGIKTADHEEELTSVVDNLLSMEIGGEPVTRLLIEKKLGIENEFYAGITFDPLSAGPVLMVSRRGGMDIESVADEHPENVIKTPLDPLEPIRRHQLMALALTAGISGKVMVRTVDVVSRLVRCYFRHDAITAEINPLVVDTDGAVWAADARMDVDDAAIFRSRMPKQFIKNDQEENPLEVEARNAGVSYVRLDARGNIGLIAGGAGVGMATMDTVYALGGIPANFLDLGGIATPQKTAAALKVVLKTPGVEGVLLNAFGGINNCREMAEGVIRVLDELNPAQVIVVKMRGHSQEKGWALLAKRDVPVIKYGTTEEGVALLMDEMEKKGIDCRVHIN